MKKISIPLAMALSASALCLILSPRDLCAQQIGDNFTIVVPVGKVTDLKKVLVVTSKPKTAAAKVGDCKSGEVHFSDANIVSRDEKGTPIATEVAIVIPGGSGIAELKPGWRIGSLRPGGKCGPGYEAFLAHLIAME